jgi:uncharacterized protein (TIGR03437 family)
LAQFSSLSTNTDGSVLYFSTPLREKGTDEPTYGKIFSIDSSGLHLLYSRDIADRDKPCSSAYNLTDIGTSSDGRVQAVAGQCSCLNGNPFDTYNCVKINRYTTTVISSGAERDYPGELWLSRNGKLALQRRGADIEFNPYAYYVSDLAAGQTLGAYGNVSGSPNPFSLLDTTVSPTGRALADNGSAVLSGGILLMGGAIRQYATPSPQMYFTDATIDASGQTIVLAAHNSVTSRDSLRITTPGMPTTDLFVYDGYLPSLTDDGRLVVYVSARTGTPQGYAIGTDGNGHRALTNEPDGIAQAIVSGDGAVAYATTLGGRILKISVTSGTVQELLPRTPHLNFMFPQLQGYSFPGFSPGKRVMIPGGGLSDGSYSAAPPLPQSLGGVSASIQGLPVPILNVNPTAVDLLVPADANPGTNGDYQARFHFQAPSPSPFDAAFDVTAALLTSAPEAVKTIHEDWGAPVSADSPAHPGEILHTYAFGLGPTVPAVPFGQAAPAVEPLAPLSAQLPCTDVTDRNSPAYNKVPVEILFAGLAPGMVAVYQVDWRVPQSAGAYDYFGVSCLTSSGLYWGVTVPTAPGP